MFSTANTPQDHQPPRGREAASREPQR